MSRISRSTIALAAVIVLSLFFRYRESRMPSLVYAKVWHERGTAHASAGREREAIHCFKKVIYNDPSCGKVYLDMGKAYHKMNQTDLMIVSFLRAGKCGFKLNGLAHYELGEYFYKRGNIDEAAENLESAATIRDKSFRSVACDRLARIYLEEDNIPKLEEILAFMRSKRIPFPEVIPGKYTEALRRSENDK